MEPQKKFENINEVFSKDGIPIGFTIPDSDFFYKYLPGGGWKDQDGNRYNSQGVFIKKSDEDSQPDEDEEDDEILDEFQKMLDDESPSKKQPKEEQSEEQIQIDYDEETKPLIQKYKAKDNIREGLPSELHLYFKMKKQFYVKVQPKTQKGTSVQQRNQIIKSIVGEANKQSQELKDKNKWLSQAIEFDFSGQSLDQKTYERYWYGYVKTTPDNYMNLREEIKNSEEFWLLQRKSYYALKSKFYLKKKMRQTIQGLSDQLKDVDENHIVNITVNNLPENFPCSYILDLFDYSDTPIDELHSFQLKDEYTGEVKLSKKGAMKFLNVEGFTHDEKEYIYLDVSADPEKEILKKSPSFKIMTDSDYKMHYCELHDTMALNFSKEEVVKMCNLEQEKNEGYRVIVGSNLLKKLLMFRGNSLNVVKVELFLKKQA